jgi:hypothetical protein
VNIVVFNLVLIGEGQEDNTWAHNPVLAPTERKDRTDKAKKRANIDRSTSYVRARASSRLLMGPRYNLLSLIQARDLIQRHSKPQLALQLT